MCVEKKGKMADIDITDSEKIDKDALEKFNNFEDCEIEIEIPDRDLGQTRFYRKIFKN